MCCASLSQRVVLFKESAVVRFIFNKFTLKEIMKICTFCSISICDNGYKVVEGINKEILNVLLVNINNNKTFVACSSCLEKIQRYFEFKCICLYVEDYITPWVGNGDKVNIKEIFKKKVKIDEDTCLEGYKICRLCMRLIQNDIFNSVSKEEALQNQLRRCLPELNLGSISEPLICEQCFSSLQEYNHFLEVCLTSESSTKHEFNEASDDETCFEFLGEMVDESLDYKIDIEKVDLEVHCKANESKLDISKRQSKIPVLDSKRISNHTKQRANKNCAHSCKECRFSTHYSSILKAHELLRHRTPPIYMCDICEFITETKDLFVKHLKNHRGLSKKFGCQTCEYETDQKSVYFQHIRHHKDPSKVDTFKCDLCSYSTTLIPCLNNHKKLNHSADTIIYKCSSCDFITKHKFSLKEHSTQHAIPEMTYDCPQCEYKSKNKSNLRAHMIKHEDPKFKCEQCSYVGSSKRCLKKHMEIHLAPEDVKKVNCEVCSYSSRYKANLLRHMLTHKNPGQRKLLKCPKCDYEAKTKISITHHLISHKNPSEIAMHKCPECSYETKIKNKLRKHMLRHRSKYELDKVFRCSQCMYVGKTKDGLQRHSLMHKKDGEVNMYKCDKCTFQSKYSNSLKSHNLIHDPGAEIFKCDQCEYKTVHKINLKHHMITHMKLGQTPAYECAMCDFKTKYKYNLKDHSKVCKKKKI